MTSTPHPDASPTPGKEAPAASESPRITIKKGGPYLVEGAVPLSEDAILMAEDGSGEVYAHSRDFEVGETYALCRCGQSGKKPFCDGTHAKIGFEGTETASRAPYAERAQEFPGGAVNLLDDNRCAYARFCHRHGVDVWNLTEASGEGEAVRDQAIVGAWNCPTGRLESHDASTGEVYEQDFAPSIVILEDVAQGASAPLFVRGGIPLVGADGVEYERRNRYALCRCGQSQNIPFCDAMHINVAFDDGSPSLHGENDGIDPSFSYEAPKPQE